MPLRLSSNRRVSNQLSHRLIAGVTAAVLGLGAGAVGQSLVVAPSIKLLAGSGTAGSATGQMGAPRGIASDASGNLYVADSANDVVWMIPASGGAAQVVAGQLGVAGYTGDGGAPTSATLNAPMGVTMVNGSLLIADTGNNVLRLVQNGALQTVAGAGAEVNIALNQPTALLDTGGALYVADTGNHQIWKVIVSQSPSASVLIPSSQLQQPMGLAADNAGNLYVADTAANQIFRFNGSTLTAYAGTGTAGFSGDGGAPASARLSSPAGLGSDAAGNLYIADRGNNRIREVLAGGSEIITLAGTGTAGFTAAPANGLGLNAQFTAPQGLVEDALGKLDVADTGNGSVWGLNSSGGFGSIAVGATTIQTLTLQALASLALSGAAIPPGFADFAITSSSCNTTLAAGATCAVGLSFAPVAPGQRTAPLTVTDGSGNRYVFGLRGNGTGPALTVLPGVMSTPVSGGLSQPSAVAWDGAGNLFIADRANQVVQVLNNQTSAITVAGVAVAAGASAIVSGANGASGYSGDTGLATAAKLNAPQGVWVDSAEDIYIADTGNNVVREVNGATGIITTVAGTGNAGSSGDGGPALSAQLSAPIGIAGDNHGNLYIADSGNDAVRELSNGILSTMAGQLGQSGYGNDGGGATHGTLNHPAAVALDGNSNLYIADSGNNVVRVVNLGSNSETMLGFTLSAGSIQTAAGGGASAVASDAGAAQAATAVSFKSPTGVATDAAGNVYIADSGDNRVALLEVAGNDVVPVAGLASGSAAFSAASDSAWALSLNAPAAVAVNNAGSLAIADGGNSAVRLVTTTSGQADLGMTLRSGPALTLNAGLLSAGTAPLSLGGFSAATSSPASASDFTATSTHCQSGASLAAGSGCFIAVSFLPTVLAVEKGSLTVTDTALNATAATQTIALNATGISGVGVAHTLTVSFSPEIEVGDSTSISAQVLDYLDNPVAGVAVSFALPTGLTASGGTTVSTGANGVATLTVTATATGAFTISVTAAGIAAAATTRVTVGATAAPNSFQALYSITQASAVVGSNLSMPVAVRLIDSPQGAPGQYAAPAGVSVTFTAASGLSFANGTGTVTVQTDATGTAYMPAVRATGPPGSYSIQISTTAFTIGNPNLLTVYEVEPPASAPATLFSPTAVGQSATASYTYTVPVAISANETVGKVVALTAGRTSLDFAVSATTCSGAYAASATCSVSLTFTPEAAGLRRGVIALQTSFGQTLGEIYVSGTGLAPVAGFNTYTTITATINGGGFATGLAVNGAGNLYLTTTPSAAGGSAAVYTAGVSTPGSNGSLSLLNGYLLSPSGVAVDGNGNIYVADAERATVTEFVNIAGSASAPAVIGSGWISPSALAVDGGGNLYVADPGQHSVVEVSAAGTQTTLPLTGLVRPDALTLDANQDLYVADGAGAVYEYNLATQVKTVLAPTAGWVAPSGIAVDPAGDVYVADSGFLPGSQVVEITGSSVTSLGLATTQPHGLAMDGLGNLIVADNTSKPQLVIAALETPGTFKFSIPDSTSGSAQTAATPLNNIGNAALNLSALSVTSGSTIFSPVTTGAGVCNTTTPVAAAASCQLTVQMAPAAPASAVGTLTVTDNSNNQAAATQALGLNGTGAGEPVTLAVNGTPTLTQIIGATVAGPISVLVTDINGNPVQGAQISFTLTQTAAGGAWGFFPNASGVTATALSNNNGIATLAAAVDANETVGAWTIVATAVANPAATVSFNLNNTPAAASVLEVSPSSNNPAAGASFTVTVTAGDGFGHTVTNYAGTVALTSSDGQAILPASSTLTNGVGTFTVTLKTSGNQTVTATGTTVSGASITGSANLNVAAGPVTQLLLSVPGGTMVNGALQTTGQSGVPIVIRASAEDQYGNVNLSATDAVSFNSGDGQSGSGTMGQGVVLLPYTPLIPNTPQNPLTQVTVTDSTRSLTASFQIAIGPGLPANFTLNSPSPLALNSTGLTPLVAHVTDGHLDNVPGATVTFTMGLVGESARPTFSNGLTAITMTTDANGNAAPAINAGPHAGNFQVSVVLTNASGATVYSQSAILTVSPGAQTITFPTIPSQQAGAAPYLLNATSSSGETVEYTIISGPSAIETLNGAFYLVVNNTPGTVVIEADAPATADYAAAPAVQQTFQVTAATASLSASALTFGSVAVGSSATQTLTISDPSPSALTITSIAMNSGTDFQASQNCLGTLAASGGSCAITVTFAPTTSGTRSDILLITDNAGNSPQQVTLTGSATAPGVSVTNFVDFGSSPQDITSSARPITITNTGDATLNITATVITGPFAPVTGSSCSVIQAGTSCSLSLTFTPPDQGREDVGNLAITDSLGTQNVILNGYGTSGGVTVTPSAVNFAPTVAGATSLSQQITLTYLGGVPITFVTTTSVAGFHADPQSCAFPLNQVGQTCTLSAYFTPSAGALPGPVFVNLQLADDQGGQLLSISGSVLSSSGALDPSQLAFGSQTVGTSSPSQTVSLVNPGTTPISVAPTVPSGFTLQNECPATLAANSECEINVSFNPTTAGAVNGNLSVATGSGGPIVASLSGRGVDGIAADPASLNFGGEPVGAVSVDQTVYVTNTGTASFTLATFTVNGDFSIYQNQCQQVLTPGATCQLFLVYTPTVTGNETGSLVMSDSTGAITVSTALSGLGTLPGITAAPANVNFGSSPVAANSSPETITVTDDGTAALTVQQLATLGDFSVANTTCLTGTGGAVTLAANGGNCIINLVMDPSSPGSRSGTLQIFNNANGEYDLALTGNGQGAGVSVSPSQLNFGSAPVGTSLVSLTGPTQAITVTNTGTSPLTVSGISAQPGFTQTNTCIGTSVPANGGTCTITVGFSPTALGTWDGTLTITDNSSTSPTQIVTLQGLGSPNGLTMSPAIVAFGGTVIGQTSAPTAITLTNGTGQTINSLAITPSGEFAVSANTCGSSLASPGTCTFNVTVTPLTPGPYTGSISVSGALASSGAAVKLGLDEPAGRLRAQAVQNSQGIAAVAMSGSGDTPGMQVSTASLSFAAQAVGTTSASQTVIITNQSASSALTGLSVTSSAADFAVANPCGASIAASGTCTLTVTFSPKAPGARTGSLTVTAAGGFQDAVALSGSGTGVSLGANPSTLSFGSAAQGTTSAPLALTLSATGSGSVTLQSAAFSNADFSIASSTCGTLPATLTAPASCTLNLVFTPSGTTTESGTLTIASNATNGAVVVPMSGAGGTAGLELSPGAVNFGNQGLGSHSAAHAITLTNAGSSALAITSITATGDFIQTNNCTASLAAGASCTAQVTFTPSASGARTGELSIVNAVATQSVALAGTGTNFTLSAAGGAVNIDAGGTATYTLSLTPGQFTGTVALGCSGAPVNSTCSINPASLSLTAGGAASTATVTLATVSRGSVPPAPPASGPAPWEWLAAAAFGALLGMLALAARASRRRWLLGAVAGLAFAAAACGGASNLTTNHDGTPAGSYTLVVTATSGTATQSVNLTVTVN